MRVASRPAGLGRSLSRPARRHPESRARSILTRTHPDAAVCLVFLALAGWVAHGLWPDPTTRALTHNPNDQILDEWFLAHGVLFWTGDFALHTTRLNAPDGINLMSNASHILQGILLAPVTVIFGASTSFAVLVVLNLAATAAGWYLLFARGLGRDRLAAMVGGLVAGFSPGMLSQSHHPQIATQWLIPPMIWCVILLTRARTPRAIITAALGLAGLASAQALLAEEVLYLTVLTMAIFAVAYAAGRVRWAVRVAGRVLPGLALTAAVSGLLLVYPLWMQFHGPQHTTNAPFAAKFFPADLYSFVAISPLSVGGSAQALELAQGPAELNSFLGLPLTILVVALVIWRRRSPVVAAAAVTIVVMAWLSLGVTVIAHGEPTDLPSLYQLIADLPVIDAALPTRYALALAPLVAVVLVEAISSVRPVPAVRPGGPLRLPSRSLAATQATLLLATLMALAPIFPLPLPTMPRSPLPTFVTTGAWRQCVPDGGVLVPVPLPTPGDPDRMRWAAAANDAFALPEGIFLAPYAAEGRTSVGTYKQPTSRLLAEVDRTGVVAAIDDATRAQADRDLAFWGADCVALAHVPNEPALLTTLERLLGPGTLVADTWTWRVSR